MSEELDNVIKVFSKFLDPDILEKYSKKGKTKKIQTIDDLLQLPIYAFNFLSESEAKILEEVLDVYDINEATKLDKKNPFDRLIDLESTGDPIKATEMREKLKQQIEVLKEKVPNLEKNLKKAITIGSLLKGIQEKEVELRTDEIQKVIVVGLDNAGKTAILSRFGGKLGIDDLKNLKPTKGLERQQISGQNVDLTIWDLGGQKDYREKYLSNPESYFLAVDLLMYVIDVQDPDRFEESFEYFNNILDILKTLQERPHILVFFHKVDPDIKKDPSILLNIELLKEKTRNLFNEVNFNLDPEIYLTSIYSLFSNEPEFSKFIKDVMQADALNDPVIRKVEGLGKILEETMNAVIRLSESLSIQLMEMDARLRAIESGGGQVTQLKGPPSTTEGTPQSAQENVRSNVLGELRDLFAKKKTLDL